MLIKCYIETFENFIHTLNNSEYIYIEKVHDDGRVIPELYGLIITMHDENSNKFALCVKDLNTHIGNDEYNSIIVNCRLTDNVHVKLYSMNDALNIYRYMNKEHLRCFLIDDTFVKYMN